MPGETVDAARDQLARGRARILRRAMHAGARRGIIGGGIAGAVLLLISSLFGALPVLWDSVGARSLVLASALSLGASASGIAVRLRAAPRVPELWDRAGSDRSGLASTAVALLTRAGPARSAFEYAVLRRFSASAPPGDSALVRIIPGITSGPLVAALLLVVLALVLPPRLEGGERSGVGLQTLAGERASSQAPADRVPIRERRARERAVAALRDELALREELALLLGDSRALTSLTAALLGGGVLPTLPGLESAERAALLRAAAHARGSGAPESWSAHLEQLAGGAALPPGPGSLDLESPHLIDAAAALAALAGSWERGGAIEGRPGVQSPELADGGGSSPAGIRGPEADLTGLPTGGGNPLELPPGLPLGPGSPQGETVDAVRGSPGVDPAEGWLRRRELEPRWFPVIEAFRRGEGVE